MELLQLQAYAIFLPTEKGTAFNVHGTQDRWELLNGSSQALPQRFPKRVPRKKKGGGATKYITILKCRKKITNTPRSIAKIFVRQTGNTAVIAVRYQSPVCFRFHWRGVPKDMNNYCKGSFTKKRKWKTLV